MKKIVFALAVFLWAGVLMLLSFSRSPQNNGEGGAVTIDLSEWEKLYRWNPEKKTFSETSLTGSRSGPDISYFHRLSPIDGIYYRSQDTKPFVLKKSGNANIVTFGSGLFVCNIRTGLETYEFRSGDLTVTPQEPGAFLIDTTNGQTKVFSFDAFLRTELTEGIKRSHVASFNLFPSLLYVHDPKNTRELKNADILRISIVDSIRYADMKAPEDGKLLFSWDQTKQNETFFTEAQKDITTRIAAFAALYDTLAKQDHAPVSGAAFFDTSSFLFVNGSKKEALLKNTLVGNIVGLLAKQPPSSLGAALNDTVSEMRNLSPKAYAEGVSILKRYYYVAVFSPFANRENISDPSSQESPLPALAEKIMAGSIRTKEKGEYYSQLSKLFSAYYFSDLKPLDLNRSFEQILQKVLDNKVLAKNEFLPFAFFVTQYLSTGPVLPNEDTMLTISHLFQITNDYYMNYRSDGPGLATVTSTVFYNYTRIFSKIYSISLNTFTDKTPEGMLLKKEYVKGEDTNLDEDFVETFTKVVNSAKKDTEDKKGALYSKDGFQPDPRVTDSYTVLKSTLASFDTLMLMFSNYPKYLTDFHLNDRNRSAKGILVEKWEDMSLEILTAYLKNFNNLDISSLQVTNNFLKDGFYDVRVNIMGNAFSFKLWERNHILADLSYSDTFGEKHSFQNITIPLDQKQEQFKGLLSSSDNPALQYKYDFGNFFETTFLRTDSASVAPPSPEAGNPTKESPPAATPEIQLFIQKELLDKDFKNIADFLPIAFKNITASINEGNYIIELKDLRKNFPGGNGSYMTEMSGKYIFNRHSFSRLVLRVKKQSGDEWYEFNGTPVEILPPRISLLSVPDTLKDLGYYIDTIKTSYTNQQSVVIDLIGKKVLLDKVPFVVKFKTE